MNRGSSGSPKCLSIELQYSSTQNKIPQIEGNSHYWFFSLITNRIQSELLRIDFPMSEGDWRNGRTWGNDSGALRENTCYSLMEILVSDSLLALKKSADGEGAQPQEVIVLCRLFRVSIAVHKYVSFPMLSVVPLCAVFFQAIVAV
ncbi:hypothetical protein TIFTF001_005586 [Ficus carica]|uniref:Uncharacterized protein n=1 Tax=Ficus carica TaxID=3494 RepID=A0AA88A859_FICCA|nr:hypothetical protein TIFTF001_005586 [Ficus carica]